ncbi:MAG: prepilin-type N-terminal cleavage/methylation domain-containing protein [Candidatus Niyogibacteria bacterium]|nr:MAG: prepilin-type N-terminal cleavage/methylation domain-containing protein [Candidatus Niyogibacteria bacterium]
MRTNDTNKKITGFTLLEMVVAIGVFSVAVLLAVSSFLSLQNAEKKIQSSVNLQNNLRFALEIMAKEIRTGEFYHCGLGGGVDPADCLSGESSLTFQNALGQTVIYRNIDSKIQKSSDGGVVFQSLSSGDITVDDLKFYVVGSPSGDNLQPRVTITVKASKRVGANVSEFSLQTSVSQRKLAP